MKNALLTFLLFLQLFAPLSAQGIANELTYQPAQGVRQEKTWWGLIDPALALWFARLPGEEDAPVLWDFSWQGFWAALFPQPLVKEAAHAPAS